MKEEIDPDVESDKMDDNRKYIIPNGAVVSS